MIFADRCEDLWPLGWLEANRAPGVSLADVGNYHLRVRRTDSYYRPFRMQVYQRDNNQLVTTRDSDTLWDLLQWTYTYVKGHPPYIPELTP